MPEPCSKVDQGPVKPCACAYIGRLDGAQVDVARAPPPGYLNWAPSRRPIYAHAQGLTGPWSTLNTAPAPRPICCPSSLPSPAPVCRHWCVSRKARDCASAGPWTLALMA